MHWPLVLAAYDSDSPGTQLKCFFYESAKTSVSHLTRNLTGKVQRFESQSKLIFQRAILGLRTRYYWNGVFFYTKHLPHANNIS